MSDKQSVRQKFRTSFLCDGNTGVQQASSFLLRGESQLRVQTSGFGGTNVLKVQAKLLDGSSWTELDSITGNDDSGAIDISAWDEVRFNVTTADGEGRVVASGFFNKAAGGGGVSDSFSTIDVLTGTNPVASGASTLTLDSTDDSMEIEGTSGTDTIDFRVAEAGKHLNFRKTYEFTADFIIATLEQLTSRVSGTSAANQASTFGVDGTEKAQAALRSQTGTTSTGRAAYTNNDNNLVFTSGVIQVLYVRACVDVLSDATEDYNVNIGFVNTAASAGDPTTGIYFKYNYNINSGKWEARVRGGSGPTLSQQDTGVAPAAGVFQDLEIHADGVNNEIRFYVNGTLTNTYTGAALPLTTQPFGFHGKIEKTVGSTQRIMYTDTVSLRIYAPSGR